MTQFRLSLAHAKPFVRDLRRALLGLAGAFAVFTFAAPAQAATLTWNLSFTLNGEGSGTATLTTADTPAGGPYTVTSLTGTFDGFGAMTLLPVIPGITDNEIYGGAGGSGYLGFYPFDEFGLGFTAGGDGWNIYYDSGLGGLAWISGDHGGGSASAVLSETPLPAALPLFGAAFGAGGMVMTWRRKRKAIAA
jgi:hypothetical protein